MPTDVDLLADLLDGNVEASEVPAELAELATLANAVSQHITLVPPTDGFREALREDVLEAVGGQAAAGGTAATTSAVTGTATGASGGMSAVIAGVAATAVLAAGTVTAADRAGPGDLLAGLDRGLESVQLALAGDVRDAELLVDFAAERVLEALEVADLAVVEDLLDEAESLADDALALGVAQGRDLEELLEPYLSALSTLATRTGDPDVLARIDELFAAVGIGTVPDAAGTGTDADGATGDSSGEGSTDPATGDGATDDTVDDTVGDVGDTVDDTVDDVGDTVDDVGDTVDDATDPIDDATDPIDDATEPIDDATEPVDDVVDGVNDAVDDATNTVDDLIDDGTGVLAP